jgi:hypothetical protein
MSRKTTLQIKVLFVVCSIGSLSGHRHRMMDLICTPDMRLCSHIRFNMDRLRFNPLEPGMDDGQDILCIEKIM